MNPELRVNASKLALSVTLSESLMTALVYPACATVKGGRAKNLRILFMVVVVPGNIWNSLEA
jgi:hypothetical protein